MHDHQAQLEEIVCLLQRGAVAVAENKATEFVQQLPSDAQGWFLLGVACHMQRRHDEALKSFDRTLCLTPDHLQALQAKAAILAETGRFEGMLAACKQAATLAPNDASTRANLGTALQKLDRAERALEEFDRALALDPSHINALLNKGVLLVKMQRLEDALIHNQAFVAQHPNFSEAYYNLADTELLLHEYEQALITCSAGLVRAPQHAGLHMKRGIALSCLSQFQPAQEALTRAHDLSPGILSGLLPNLERRPAPADIGRFTEPALLATSLFLAANLKAQEECNWQRRDNFLNALENSIENGLPHAGQLHDKRLAQPLLSMPLPPEIRLKAMRNISLRVAETAHAHKLPPFTHLPRTSGRISIGYVSPDFRDHSVGYLSKPIYRLHDRSRFKIHCYSLRNAPEDATQKDIAAACDHWHDISGSDPLSTARRIHADGIDILIDMAGYTRDADLELFALRPAPVQAHFLGYPGTLGADFLDYVIADSVVCPEAYRPYVSEKLILLPNTYCPYDTSTPNALTTLKRSDAGLPESGFVFCCFNASYKIEPIVFECWLKLLQKIPDSVLWLVSQHPAAKNNLRRQAACHGIAPERLVFTPYMSREHYLSSFQLADLFLDTRWHNAHTMAADALWQGLPVLTCAGPHWSSRLAASLLQAAGLPELITQTLEDYAALALHLARDRAQLAALRHKLAAARTTAPLFAPEITVRHLEDAYQAMWDAWCARQTPGGTTCETGR